jgi:hypothetical protein
MAPDTQHTLKAVAGTTLIIGIVINFFERWYSPHRLLLASSPEFPAWLGWLGWILASVAAFVYIAIDIAFWSNRHKEVVSLSSVTQEQSPSQLPAGSDSDHDA